MINLMKLYGWVFSKKYIYQHNEIICLLKRIYGNIFKGKVFEFGIALENILKNILKYSIGNSLTSSITNAYNAMM